MMNDAERTAACRAIDALQARLIGENGPFELVRMPNGTRRFKSGAKTLREIYLRALRMGDKPLLARGARQHSYSSILTPALARAAKLRREHRAGQRIGLLLEDGAEWLIWFVAITAAGASCVLPPLGGGEKLVEHCLGEAGCDVVVATPDQAAARSAENLWSNDESSPGAEEMASLDPDSEVLVVFTSGSSGKPKAVSHSHRSLLTGLRNMMLGGALTGILRPRPAGTPAPALTPSALVLSPLAYLSGYAAFLMTISAGGRIILASGARGEIADIVERDSPQSIVGASSEVMRQLIRVESAAKRLRSLRRLQIHGEGLQRALVEEIQAILPDVHLTTGYGLTETAGSIATADVSWVLGTPGACGRLLPSVDLRIVDEHGQAALPGEPGYIQVRGAMVMRGYLGSSTATAFTSDAWLQTGDIGSMDRLGWLSAIDRENRKLAATSGEESYCWSIEEAVRAVADVDDAAVAVSIARASLIIFVQPREGSKIDVGRIRSVAKSCVRWSGEIEIRTLGRLPRTTTGKVSRTVLATEAG